MEERRALNFKHTNFNGKCSTAVIDTASDVLRFANAYFEVDNIKFDIIFHLVKERDIEYALRIRNDVFRETTKKDHEEWRMSVAPHSFTTSTSHIIKILIQSNSPTLQSAN